jgi:hypothetical protein
LTPQAPLDLARRLRAAAASLPPGKVALATLAEAHGGALHATLLVLLAAPCMLPIPGVGTMLSFGLLLLALLMWRAPASGLPARLARIELPREGAVRTLTLLARFYDFVDDFAKPRLPVLAGPAARWWVAPGVVLMAAVIFLPIPFGNVLPAVSLMLAGLALAMRDGLAMLLAMVVGLLALALTAAMLTLGWQASLGALARIF